jgi:hypothetical protein
VPYLIGATIRVLPKTEDFAKRDFNEASFLLNEILLKQYFSETRFCQPVFTKMRCRQNKVYRKRDFGAASHLQRFSSQEFTLKNTFSARRMEVKI